MALKLPDRNPGKTGEPKQSARARMGDSFDPIIPAAAVPVTPEPPAADPFPPQQTTPQVVDLSAATQPSGVRLVQPAPKKVRAKRPVTREKVSLVLDKATKQRFMNTFAYLNRTGQADRYSHVAAQALNDFCERIENDYNSGQRFPSEDNYIAPTGAPRRQEPGEA